MKFNDYYHTISYSGPILLIIYITFCTNNNVKNTLLASIPVRIRHCCEELLVYKTDYDVFAIDRDVTEKRPGIQ